MVTLSIDDPVNKFELQILQLIENKEIERSTHILNQMDKSHKQIKRYLGHLKELEYIEFTGSSKTGRYVLTEKGKRRV